MADKPHIRFEKHPQYNWLFTIPSRNLYDVRSDEYDNCVDLCRALDRAQIRYEEKLCHSLKHK